MQPEKMIRMANQIAQFFDSQPGAPVAEIASHIKNFWEPRMRAQLFAHIDAGAAGLRPGVVAAAQRLRSPT